MPEDAVTIDGEPLTVDGEFVTFGGAAAEGSQWSGHHLDDGVPVTDEGLLVTEDGVPLTTEAGDALALESEARGQPASAVRVPAEPVEDYDPQDETTFRTTEFLNDRPAPGADPSAAGQASGPQAGGEGVMRDEGTEAAASAGPAHASSGWTGRRTFAEHATVVRRIAPIALSEIDALAAFVEDKRLNAPEVAAALALLRSLHEAVGELIGAVEEGRSGRLARALSANAALLENLKRSVSLITVAPAMTIGVSHLLAHLTGVALDSTLISTVYATVAATPLVKDVLDGRSGSAHTRKAGA